MVKKERVYGYSSSQCGRYVGIVSQKKFIEEVSKLDRASKNWVRERIAETGNDEELRLARENKGKIVQIKEKLDKKC